MATRKSAVFKVLLANAGSFFGAGNGNYDEGAGTVLSSASLFAGPQDMPIVTAFLQGKQSPAVEFFGFDAECLI